MDQGKELLYGKYVRLDNHSNSNDDISNGGLAMTTEQANQLKTIYNLIQNENVNIISLKYQCCKISPVSNIIDINGNIQTVGSITISEITQKPKFIFCFLNSVYHTIYNSYEDKILCWRSELFTFSNSKNNQTKNYILDNGFAIPIGNSGEVNREVDVFYL